VEKLLPQRIRYNIELQADHLNRMACQPDSVTENHVHCVPARSHDPRRIFGMQTYPSLSTRSGKNATRYRVISGRSTSCLPSFRRQCSAPGSEQRETGLERQQPCFARERIGAHLSNSFAGVARRGSPIAHRPHDLNDLAREIEIVTLGTWAK
jgi:hypothetical protein